MPWCWWREKKCVDKKWNECAHVQRIQRERHRPKHTCNVYIHNIVHIQWLWWWWWRRRTEKMPIKFVVSAKIIIRNVNSISLERTTFCLHSPRHSFDLFHVMRAMHLSRSRSFFRFFSLVLFHVALVLYLFRFKTFQISHRHNALFSLISSGFSENCPHRNETPGNATK